MPAGTGAVGEEHDSLGTLGDIQDSFELHRTRRNPDLALFHRSPPPFKTVVLIALAHPSSSTPSSSDIRRTFVRASRQPLGEPLFGVFPLPKRPSVPMPNSASPQPLTTIRGLRRATFFPMPARSVVSTTSVASLYASDISSSMVARLAARIRIPLSSSSPLMLRPFAALFAARRPILRPAPWALEPKVSLIASSVPASTKE